MEIEEIERKHILIILDYCKEKWGKSKFVKKYPKISFRVKKNAKFYYGDYHSGINVINVYLSRHKKILELCKTVIHEYTHYLQCMNKYENYIIVAKKNYDNHPYEKTARYREKKFGKECKKYLLNRIKNGE